MSHNAYCLNGPPCVSLQYESFLFQRKITHEPDLVWRRQPRKDMPRRSCWRQQTPGPTVFILHIDTQKLDKFLMGMARPVSPQFSRRIEQMIKTSSGTKGLLDERQTPRQERIEAQDLWIWLVFCFWFETPFRWFEVGDDVLHLDRNVSKRAWKIMNCQLKTGHVVFWEWKRQTRMFCLVQGLPNKNKKDYYRRFFWVYFSISEDLLWTIPKSECVYFSSHSLELFR